MNRKTRGLLAAVMLAGMITGSAEAQPPGRGHGTHHSGYSSGSVVTVSGKVTAVTRSPSTGHMGPGIHLTLQEGKTSLEVILGPARYVEEQSTKIKVGDNVRVLGSRTTFEGKPALIAARVDKAGGSLGLRDPHTGVPYWSRGQRGRGSHGS